VARGAILWGKAEGRVQNADRADSIIGFKRFLAPAAQHDKRVFDGGIVARIKAKRAKVMEQGCWVIAILCRANAVIVICEGDHASSINLAPLGPVFVADIGVTRGAGKCGHGSTIARRVKAARRGGFHVYMFCAVI